MKTWMINFFNTMHSHPLYVKSQSNHVTWTSYSLLHETKKKKTSVPGRYQEQIVSWKICKSVPGNLQLPTGMIILIAITLCITWLIFSDVCSPHLLGRTQHAAVCQIVVRMRFLKAACQTICWFSTSGNARHFWKEKKHPNVISFSTCILIKNGK